MPYLEAPKIADCLNIGLERTKITQGKSNLSDIFTWSLLFQELQSYCCIGVVAVLIVSITNMRKQVRHIGNDFEDNKCYVVGNLLFLFISFFLLYVTKMWSKPSYLNAERVV